MTDTQVLAGGDPVDNLTLVTADQTTITGDGSSARPLSAIPGGSPDASPARTLFVAKSWSVPVDPTTHFTSIAAAYAYAATLAGADLPSLASPIEILVYPGTYPEPITVVSNVHLVGGGQQRSVVVTGPVTWACGAGVNLPQAGVEERFNVAFMTFTNLWTLNSTAKTAGISSPIFRGVILQGGMNYTGRGAGPGVVDSMIFFVSVGFGGAYTFTNVQNVRSYGVLWLGLLIFNGATAFEVAGGRLVGGLTTNSTVPGLCTGLSALDDVTVGPGSYLTMAGCFLQGITVAVGAGGTADLRASNLANSTLVGPGAIDRTTFTGTIVTAAGVNPVPFAVPYPVGAVYNVNLQLASGPGNAAVTVDAGFKNDGGFVVTDAVGLNTFDYTVTRG